jgi:hypothetical protein
MKTLGLSYTLSIAHPRAHRFCLQMRTDMATRDLQTRIIAAKAIVRFLPGCQRTYAAFLPGGVWAVGLSALSMLLAQDDVKQTMMDDKATAWVVNEGARYTACMVPWMQEDAAIMQGPANEVGDHRTLL